MIITTTTNSFIEVYNSMRFSIDNKEDLNSVMKEFYSLIYSKAIELPLMRILDVCSSCPGMTLEEYGEVLANVREIRKRIYGY